MRILQIENRLKTSLDCLNGRNSNMSEINPIKIQLIKIPFI